MTRDGTYWDIGTVPHVEPDRLSSIISALADFAMVIDRDGKIISVLASPSHTSIAALDQWENANVRDYLTTESVRKFEDTLAGYLSDPKSQRATELNHYDGKTKVEFPVVYTMHHIGSEETILLMGRDLRPIADMQRQLVDAQIAVERDFEVKRGYDTRFRVLMQSIQDAVVFVNVSTGSIIDANAAAATLLRRTVDELKGTEFAKLFEDQGRSELLAEMAASALSEGPAAVRLVDQKSSRIFNATPSFFRAAGTRTMLCRLTPEAAIEASATDPLPRALGAVFESGPDAILITDADGRIASANEAFLDMTDAAHNAAVEGRSLADYLDRGSVDLNVLLDGTGRSGRTRIYNTKLKGQFEGLSAVNISVTPVEGDPKAAFAFVIRSTETHHKSDAEPHAESAQSAVDLVGNASLKEIVADTTDVIEKICIETAIELTANNRVAAAEMLGLSRQSLYVKLRKYGLLSRSNEG
ncbi:MAG: transcriptional regulator PpsR [Silicimonas sp.]|nr:transcriptional regulator PpsR [Silicimonas sp.]